MKTVTLEIEDLFSKDFLKSEPNNILTLNHDVLALSCCSYRLAGQSNSTYQSFHSRDSSNLLTDEDNRVADDIRSYYGKKYLWRSLKGQTVSEFQTALLEFLNMENRCQYYETQHGLIHKLPEFYFNDILIDEIFRNADNTPIEDVQVPPFLRQKYVKMLTPVNVVKERTRRNKTNTYWLKDSSNRLHSLEIAHPNNLEHIWIDLFNTSAEIKIKAHFMPHSRPNSVKHYYKIVDWTLEK